VGDFQLLLVGVQREIRMGNHSKWEIVLLNQEADELLISQCKNQFLPALRKIPHWNEMSDGKRGALLSFAYNLGAGFYGGDNFNTITKRLKNKEWDLVPDALFLYRNPGSNVEAGLARRRKAEGESWKKG
jgi:GH24 family phage-related lysozyme (muramidase)